MYRELGEHVLAAADFGNCVGLWPEFAWGYFNRGCALDQGGNKTQAILDYTTAIERDPDVVAAFAAPPATTREEAAERALTGARAWGSPASYDVDVLL